MTDVVKTEQSIGLFDSLEEVEAFRALCYFLHKHLEHDFSLDISEAKTIAPVRMCCAFYESYFHCSLTWAGLLKQVTEEFRNDDHLVG